MHKALVMQKRFGKLLDLKSICTLTLVVFFMTSTAYAHPDDWMGP